MRSTREPPRLQARPIGRERGGAERRVISTLHRDLVPKRGLTVDCDRPFMAVFLNDPRVTSEVHRRTELCIPVVAIPMTLAGNSESQVYDAGAFARRLAG
jgi:hypothetical protein